MRTGSTRAFRAALLSMAMGGLCAGQSDCTFSFSGTGTADPCADGAANCGQGGDDPDPTPPTDTTVQITPDRVQVPRLGRMHFTASVSFPAGSDLKDKGVVWKVEEGFAGGTIDQNGLYAAPPQPGTYHVVATSVADPKARGRAVVRVRPSVEITPSAVHLLPEGRQQFTARVIEGDSQEVFWSIDEGEGEQTGAISKTGLFVALNVGTFHVRARSVANPELTQVAKVVVSHDSLPVFNPPELEPGHAADMYESAEFLFSGPNPIQIGAEPEIMNPNRIAVIRGRVMDVSGKPLPGVLVTVKDRPEYGSTQSRADGMFDLAVNGNSSLVVEYARDGYMRVQRPIKVPAKDWVWAEDAVMTAYDSKASAIDLRGSSEAQIAQGSEVSDESGTRRATIIFPPGVRATITLADGSTRSLQQATVRATEYTVGPTGPAAMPGPLPPTSAYTYAAELSLDEAEELNARQVDFSIPVPVYVDNFLGFKVGTPVPAAYYDREAAEWVAIDDGIVLAMVGIDDQGRAEIDAQGNGVPSSVTYLRDSLGIGDAERVKLAEAFRDQLQRGAKTFWRVRHDHFTPCDYNWPPPDDAVEPGTEPEVTTKKVPDPCNKNGSIIECENQTLGQRIAISGTPYSLSYNSSRVAGHRAKLSVELTQDEIHNDLEAIEVTVEYAGHRLEREFTSLGPNMDHEEILPSNDAYGRAIRATITAFVSIEYRYNGNYLDPDGSGRSFGASGSQNSGVGARSGGRSNYRWPVPVTVWDAREFGLGGWTVSSQHKLDIRGERLLHGDGSFRSLPSVGPTVSIVAGCRDPSNVEEPCSPPYLQQPANRAVLGPQSIAHLAGIMLVSDWLSNRIYQVQAGAISPFGRMDAHQFTAVRDIAVHGSDVYFIDENQVLKADPHRRISVIAGGGNPEAGVIQDKDGLDYDQDGEYAPYIGLSPNAIAVDRLGTLYVASTRRLRRVGADQIARMVRRFAEPIGALAPNPAGGVYVIAMDEHALPSNSRWTLWRTSGIGAMPLATFDGPTLEVARALLASGASTRLFSLAASPTGDEIYIGSQMEPACMRVYAAGAVHPVLGSCESGGWMADPGEGSAQAINNASIKSIDFSPAGHLRFASLSNIYEYRDALGGSSGAEVPVPSEDGRLVYRFDRRGRHVDTLDALLGFPVMTFDYDEAGRLSAITDRDGRTTTISRSSPGVVEIESPDGVATSLETSAQGYLSRVVKPGGADVRMTYDAGNRSGLMLIFTDERGHTKRYNYDDSGLLVSAVDAAGGRQDLRRSRSRNTTSVAWTSGERRQTVHEVERANGGTNRSIKRPDGLVTTFERRPDGTTRRRDPNGFVVTTTNHDDPRFGKLSPVSSAFFETPSGRQLSMERERAVVVEDEEYPFSATSWVETVTVGPHTTTTEFDGASRTWTITSPAGRESELVVDEKGRAVEFRVPGLTPITYSYDATSGRLTTVTQGNRTQATTYDALGRSSTFTDAEGGAVELTYTPSHRVEAITLPDAESIGFTYDPAGNLLSLTPPGKPAHNFSYDPRGLADTYSPPVVGSWDPSTQWTHDYEKQPISESRPDAVVVETERDHVSGRVQRIVSPTATYDYGYNASTGQLEGVSASNGIVVTRSLDAVLLLAEQWAAHGTPFGSVEYDYDSSWRRSLITVNGTDPVAYGYDADGLITAAGDLSLERDPANGILVATSLGSTFDAYTYNTYGEPTRYVATYDGSPRLDVEYLERDKLGRITRKKETVGVETPREWTYFYDARGRLEEVTEVVNGSSQLVARSAYDGNGNRTAYETPQQELIATYDDQDRLLTFGDAASSYTYSYGANGELSSKSDGTNTAHYEYDAFGNLTRVTLPDGTVVDYLADGFGRRVMRRATKEVGGAIETVERRFVYDGRLRVVAELDESGQVLSRFVYAGGVNSPEYMVTADETTYRLVKDHLGSPRLIVDAATGAVAQRIDYDAWGKVLTDTNPGFQPFGFAGGLYDCETGLVRFGARDYDAEVGRWTAKDPIGFGGRDTLLYLYAAGNPVNRRDPTGKIVEAGDHAGLLLMQALSASRGGDVLLQYLQRSPIRYTVYGQRAVEYDDFMGQFGDMDCGNGGPQDILINPGVGMDIDDMVMTLGHELGHAALYDDFFLQREGLPEFLDPSMSIDGIPGGMNEFDHVWWYAATGALFFP